MLWLKFWLTTVYRMYIYIGFFTLPWFSQVILNLWNFTCGLLLLQQQQYKRHMNLWKLKCKCLIFKQFVKIWLDKNNSVYRKQFLTYNRIEFWIHWTYSAKFTVIYVTGPEKTGLIYIKYIYPYYDTYLLFCMCYIKSVSFIEILKCFSQY